MTPPAHGYIAFLLHAHMPYVRREDDDVTLEERWYYEAVADSYLPLIDMMDSLLRDGVGFRLTLSVSPTLLAMMEDPLMQRKMKRYLTGLSELAGREASRLRGDADFAPAAAMYRSRYRRLLELYDRLGGDLIAKLRSLRDAGCVELITCAATHAFLPLVKNAAALRAQLEAAVLEFRRHFGSAPAGIWLPECGYTPAVEPHLQALGLRWFVAPAHAHALAAAGRPLRTRGGACAFARDPEASTQVWSAEAGYPGDGEYREYYRDIGYDLGADGGTEWEYIKPYMLPDGKRIHTGLKYHRVTGRSGDAKQPYRPERAARKARQHAGHFIAARAEQIRRLAAAGEGAPPVIVCPYDAELFGHWWYEGTQWLEAVLRGLHDARSFSPGVVVETTTLSAYAAAWPPDTEAELPVSSWGRGGFAEVWLQPRSQWVHPRLHAAEDRMIRAAARVQRELSPPDAWRRRALNQAARELLLAQSSDWTFILDAGTVTEYAERRIRSHLEHFHALLDILEPADERSTGTGLSASSAPAQPADALTCRPEPTGNHCTDNGLPALSPPAQPAGDLLDRLEHSSPFLPELDYRIYAASSELEEVRAGAFLPAAPGSGKLRILMLAWEYPPRVIGGLARAVCDLSEQLATLGHTVHVITCHAADSPVYEVSGQVHIHRVQILQSMVPVHFLDWVFQMNMAFIEAIQRLFRDGADFDLVHAHDWLVFYAAKESRQTLGIPLIATVHATEYGRSQGRLETEVQQRIHRLEGKLTKEADRVIVCSRFMQHEMQRLFGLPESRAVLIPNGVRAHRGTDAPASLIHPLLPGTIGDTTGRDRIICFLGRLVHEKGAHILIDAMRPLLKRFANALLVIAGTGPALEELRFRSARYGDRVRFTGFVDGQDKERLLEAAELCVFPSLYEPFGIVALEAMSSGTPLVVSDVGGLAEIVEHGVDGCKVPPGDARALAAQIADLLERPESAKQLAEAAARKIEASYDWTGISEATVDVYRQAAHTVLSK